jgi:hypothetical protein
MIEMTRSRTRRLCLTGTLLAGLALSSIGCAGAQKPGAEATLPEGSAAPNETWRSEQPPPAAERRFDYPAAQTARLPNGVELYLVPKKSGTVALSVLRPSRARAGSRRSPCA